MGTKLSTWLWNILKSMCWNHKEKEEVYADTVKFGWRASLQNVYKGFFWSHSFEDFVTSLNSHLSNIQHFVCMEFYLTKHPALLPWLWNGANTLSLVKPGSWFSALWYFCLLFSVLHLCHCQHFAGNNVYGEDIRKVLAPIAKSKERTSYILMERIWPRPSDNYAVRRGTKVQRCKMVNELGIFGLFLGWATECESLVDPAQFTG